MVLAFCRCNPYSFLLSVVNLILPLTLEIGLRSSSLGIARYQQPGEGMKAVKTRTVAAAGQYEADEPPALAVHPCIFSMKVLIRIMLLFRLLVI